MKNADSESPYAKKLAASPFLLHYNVFASPGAAGSTGFNIFLTPIPIPEPATGMLLGLGAVGLIRRRRARAARCGGR